MKYHEKNRHKICRTNESLGSRVNNIHHAFFSLTFFLAGVTIYIWKYIYNPNYVDKNAVKGEV